MVWIIIFGLFAGSYATTLKLSPAHVHVVENSTETLTCYKENGNLAETRWSNSHFQNQWANLYISSIDQSCVATNFLLQNSLFTGICDEGVYYVRLNKIDRTQHGAEWTCKEFLTTSNKVIITVSVPATNVKLTLPNREYIKENTTENVTCQTSACRPEPRVQWYLRNSVSLVVHNMTEMSTNKYIDDANGLKAVESVLHFKVNRSFNNLYLYCVVWTQPDKIDVTSRELYLNVTYPPENAPLIKDLEDNNVIYVIEKDSGTFECLVTGGNPLASLSWNCFDSTDITSRTQGDIVTSTIKWTAHRDYTICSCVSYHIKDWKKTSNITVEVEYPPGLTVIYITNSLGEALIVQEEIISINEAKSINLTCNSTSNPMPTYRWSFGQEAKQTNVLTFNNITRKEAGTYTCYVENVMKRTHGKSEIGRNQSQIVLDILYPADINDIQKIDVLEGLKLLIRCPVIYGNPPNSTITWFRLKDDSRWNNTLFIRNVLRGDDDKYTCMVTTDLIPTVGSAVKIKRQKSFHLNVYFPPEIKSFSVSSENSNKTVFINENKTAIFGCIVESNPPSDLIISNPKDETIAKISHSNIARFTLNNASYLDAGYYNCTARNNYEGHLPTSSQLLLIIKCPPRPSSGNTTSMQVATRLHDNATLYFVARKYLDEQNKTVFTWFKENAPISTNMRKHIVLSNGLETYLSIRNITIEDIGLYRVLVTNSAGKYLHYFSLMLTADLKEKSLPSNIAAFVYVGVGSCFSTLIIVALTFVVHKRLKKFNLRCKKRPFQQGNGKDIQLSNREGNQAPVAYTELDCSKREINLYDEVNVRNEQIGSASKETRSSVEVINTVNVTKEKSDYINIAI